MVERNPDIARLKEDYLFVEIARRRDKVLADQPHAQLINLGIGDTTEPIPHVIVEAFAEKAQKLGTFEGYTGYSDPLGHPVLLRKIGASIYSDRVSADDIFISDGAKCDSGRLQLLFGRHCSMTIQDPSYPVYIAGGVMTGKTGEWRENPGRYRGIVYMPCSSENAFLPDLETLPRTDLIYICSPNNPTGAVLTRQQLERLVDHAHQRGSLIIFDSAYAAFIRDPSLPRSIYEIDGAEKVAIEIGSFSKSVGFTGVRLGWTVVPQQLCFADGYSVQKDWIKIVTTFFNGASNLAQAGGIASLSDDGLSQSRKLCDYYLENAKILRRAVESKGYACFGGDHAPYLWVDVNGQSSWDLFDRMLCHAHIVTTPGVGFGPAGEGFLRLSAFGRREHIIEAGKRLGKVLQF
ncbi:MAG: LL-diaminopimelate aminotransferase [Waddliaceae bacterium]